jgi:hypothetical protein
MGSILRRHPMLVPLLVLGAILLAIVAWEIQTGVGGGVPLASRPVRRAAAPDAKLLPQPALVQAEQQYPEFASRPLWVPTRRPAPAAPPPSGYTPGQYVLQGVIVAGNNRTAMLREKSNGHLHRVEAGKQLNGITVAEIEPDHVTLTQGADREVVPLQVQKGPAAPATPGAPGTAVAHPGVPAAPTATYGFGPPLPPGVNPTPQPQGTPVTPAPPAAQPGAVPGGGFFATPAQNPTAPPAPANGANGAPQATPSSAAMSAEELLARRRARRAPQTQ